MKRVGEITVTTKDKWFKKYKNSKIFRTKSSKETKCVNKIYSMFLFVTIEESKSTIKFNNIFMNGRSRFISILKLRIYCRMLKMGIFNWISNLRELDLIILISII